MSERSALENVRVKKWVEKCAERGGGSHTGGGSVHPQFHLPQPLLATLLLYHLHLSLLHLSFTPFPPHSHLHCSIQGPNGRNTFSKTKVTYQARVILHNPFFTHQSKQITLSATPSQSSSLCLCTPKLKSTSPLSPHGNQPRPALLPSISSLSTTYASLELICYLKICNWGTSTGGRSEKD